ncbi:MAG: hypothetical protein AUK47_02170 [Deltaproteobacteria bacterium CG2_30_63_29]|nr:MAG: hypothetical protein AUK47_02170 [Deltaproteobacteria bacterium CG2_30_63_29]PIW01920.1 MAG: ferritin [Deltaproteobacteria bacterium CG17_big_fil_post_rev_8_21_14_2_50_63_7]PJB47138.1 MAG: ferritin [Deltaproteobacteria bacterium CG_4_9_14_3_um_filter_63_12]
MKLTQKMQDALNHQLNCEMMSSYLYLGMSNRLIELNFVGASQWMRMQAEEELVHAMKLYSYLQDRGGRVKLANLEATQEAGHWNDMVSVFKAALAHEELISTNFYEMVDLALAERDHATNNLLQWFVAEQVEEEATLVTLIQKLELVGTSGPGLFLLDQELATRVSIVTIQTAP